MMTPPRPTREQLEALRPPIHQLIDRCEQLLPDMAQRRDSTGLTVFDKQVLEFQNALFAMHFALGKELEGLET